MHWSIKHQLTGYSAAKRRDEIVSVILKNRGLETPAQIKAFLHPKSPFQLTLKDVGIDAKAVKHSLTRINQAIKNQETIIVFGDYDADGITATAIIWETLHALGALVFPFIPSREIHGYGLSVKGIQDAIKSLPPTARNSKTLCITVDNGIVAHQAADYLKEQGIDLILTDHHQPPATLPVHHSLVHTTILSGAGIAWILARELEQSASNPQPGQSTLDLATIGTVADMMPLLGPNRSLVKFGLDVLKHTTRPGLKALYEEAGIDDSTDVSTYHVNFVIAPRLNAMGRLEHALDSLRLLLTTKKTRAQDLAQILGDTNRSRQNLTHNYVTQALDLIGQTEEHIVVIDHTDFHEGVIGLVAGKLVETYFRPAIVIARGQETSKASVRSVKGVNIIDYLRHFESSFINVGGHPMAAGFTIQTNVIDQFKSQIQSDARTAIDASLLEPELNVDCQIDLDDISMDLYQSLQTLKPFGMANPQPVFAVKAARVLDARRVGKTQTHLKLTLQAPSGTTFGAIGFNLASGNSIPKPNTKVDLAFTLDQNTWNGKTNLQLRIKSYYTKYL